MQILPSPRSPGQTTATPCTPALASNQVLGEKNNHPAVAAPELDRPSHPLNLDWLDACHQAIETRAAALDAARSRLTKRRAEIQQAGEVLQGWEVEDYSVLKPSGKTYWYKRRCRDRGQNDTEKCHVHIPRKAEADTLAAIARGKQLDELDRQSKQLDRAYAQFQRQVQQLQTQVESLIAALTTGEEQ